MSISKFFKTNLAALLLVVSSSSSASVVIFGTRIIYDGAQKSKNITIKNQGELPALIQAWVSPSPENKTAPFVVSPAIHRLEAGKEQILRLLYTQEDKGLAANSKVEQLYLFNMLEVPPKPKNAKDSNYLQISITNQLKLFYRPANIASDINKAASNITWQLDAARRELLAQNQSPLHITILKISAAAKNKIVEFSPAIASDKIVEGMIAPLQTYKFKSVSALANNIKTLDVTYLDDYGSERNIKVNIK